MDQENGPEQDAVGFAAELAALLPHDVPHRDRVIAGTARHLKLIAEANRHFNLTRITGVREAAIKHVVDSVLPWRLFSSAASILDAGTGAGFPGIPLALVFPEKRLVLSESVGKKARFVRSTVDDLTLVNVEVSDKRAEELLRLQRSDVVTARAVAPVERAVELFAAGLKQGGRVLLYKGPDVREEIEAAARTLRSRRIEARVVFEYSLPDGLGSRTVVEFANIAERTSG